jgi:hypothetical protein
MISDVSKKSIGFNFRVDQSHKVYSSRNVDPEEGTTILRNVGNYLPVDKE